jgi:DNA-directed RNA polymerase delta subunit
LSTLSKDDVVGVVEDWVKHLEKSKKPETIEVLVKNNPHHNKYEITFLSELPSVSKKLINTETGRIGLAKWPEVNPRNVRDKIYYVLKSEGKPLHFDEIARRINEQNFSRKKVVRTTVHNELIADNRFVLIGRGIYALSEWGYKPGTVKDVITEVMLDNKNKPMHVEEITKAVLIKRAVKKNTIVINLQTKPEFKKVGKDTYVLA